MKKLKINKIDFSEIFNFAKKKYKVEWNRANDMFFGHSLDYKSYNEFELGQPLEYIEKDKSFEELSESDKGYFIINEFMKDNNIDSIFIDNR